MTARCSYEFICAKSSFGYVTARFANTHISALLTIEFPVAQWLEDLASSQRVVGSNPMWNSYYFVSVMSFLHSKFDLCMFYTGLF